MSDEYTPLFKRQESGLWYPTGLSFNAEAVRPKNDILHDSAYVHSAEIAFLVNYPTAAAVQSLERHQQSFTNIERMGMYWDSDDSHVFQVNIEARMTEQEARELERLLCRVIERVKKEVGIVE